MERMICSIEWHALDEIGQSADLTQLRRPNLLQSPAYIRAVCALNHQRARCGLIHIDGQKAGIVNVVEAGFLKNMIHAVIIDRGPLWFEDYGHAEHFSAFTQEITRHFPRRFGRKMRFMPEVPDEKRYRDVLSGAGFVRRAPPYETMWLDLRPDTETLRANLKKNWRGALNKAEKADVTVQWDFSGAYLDWLLRVYTGDKGARGYNGASAALLKALAANFIPTQDS